MYLWMKAFHIIFMVTWFAGLFYLPRLFVYHANPDYKDAHAHYIIMEKRLFIMMTIGFIATLLPGLWLLFLQIDVYKTQAWLHAKLLLVFLLIGYHVYCWKLLKSLAKGSNQHSHRWYRYFNEIPSLLIIPIIILVVVKPF